MPAKNHPRVFIDVSIGTRAGGRIVFELFNDVTPRTCENFRGLCTGEYGTGKNTKKNLSIDGCAFFRSVKGFMVQSGDFEFNNGDGGESIYGGSFNDEDFSRRHTQAGVLSMANKGRNSNTSQFFITLKRAPQLDNKHVAFGQVVAGMDVVRAMAQVPTDKDDKPRVPIHIVGSGEEGKAQVKRTDITSQFADQIAELNEEVNPTRNTMRESTKGREILAGKSGGAPDAGTLLVATKKAAVADDDDEMEAGQATVPARNERERKLQELRMRMNAGRAKNSKEVVEEQKRFADPEYAKRTAEQRHKANMEKLTGDEKGDDKKSAHALPEGKEHLGDTIEHCDMKEAKKKRKNPDAFGWDVFNQDSLARAHDKRLNNIEFDQAAYDKQKAEDGSGSSLNPLGGFGYQPDEAAKDRLQNAMDKSADKKKEFSRRRMHNAEEDVNYVNDRNRHFNKKIERFFGEYTHETRQNLERGTAL